MGWASNSDWLEIWFCLKFCWVRHLVGVEIGLD